MSNKHTPGPWYYEPADSGDSSVGIDPTPPYVYADPDQNGDVYPVCMVETPQRKAARDPVDEYDDCMEVSGDHDANGRLMAAAPAMSMALQRAAYLLAESTDQSPAMLILRSAIVEAIKEATPEYYGLKVGK